MKKFFKNKTVIVTGHTGFKGSWLTLILIHLGAKVIGISNNIPTKPSFFQSLKLNKKIKDLRADIRDLTKVKKILKKYQPDYIFHLAAQSLVKRSFREPSNTFTTNIVGTLNILESIRTINLNCKIFIPGSAVQFKLNNYPIDEYSLQYPNSPYAIDRIYTYNLSKYYRDKFGLKIYYGYLFHHDSPLRNHNHLSIEIIKKIKLLKDTGQNQLNINNLNYTKEFNHAKDIVKAIWIFLNQEKVYELVIGSGDPISIKSFISLVLKEYGMNQNFQFGHLGKEEIVTCSPKILKKMGWTPDYNIQGLIRDIILNGNIS